jgi:hypothetical protein
VWVHGKSMKIMQHVIQQFIHKICKAYVQYSENEEYTIYCDLRKEKNLLRKQVRKNTHFQIKFEGNKKFQ